MAFARLKLKTIYEIYCYFNAKLRFLWHNILVIPPTPMLRVLINGFHSKAIIKLVIICLWSFSRCSMSVLIMSTIPHLSRFHHSLFFPLFPLFYLSCSSSNWRAYQRDVWQGTAMLQRLFPVVLCNTIVLGERKTKEKTRTRHYDTNEKHSCVFIP